MNITTTYFLELFEEFLKVSKPKLTAYITIASTRVPQAVWGNVTDYATALLTAHMLSTSGPQGGGPAGGALTAEQVGDLSRGFATVFEPGSGDAALMTTRYGIDFIALRNETIIPLFTTSRIAAIPPGGCY